MAYIGEDICYPFDHFCSSVYTCAIYYLIITFSAYIYLLTLSLQVLVTALLDTIRKWVINIILLLLLLMFLFAIMGYYFFGYRDDGDRKNWGDLGSAMLTLFSYVTVGLLLITPAFKN